MPRDFAKDYAVRLLRHIGQQMTKVGPLEIEHDQKIVMMWCPGIALPLEVGIIPDADGTRLLWNPYRLEDVEKQSGFREWVESQALAEKAAGRFYDNWQASNPKRKEAEHVVTAETGGSE